MSGEFVDACFWKFNEDNVREHISGLSSRSSDRFSNSGQLRPELLPQITRSGQCFLIPSKISL